MICALRSALFQDRSVCITINGVWSFAAVIQCGGYYRCRQICRKPVHGSGWFQWLTDQSDGQCVHWPFYWCQCAGCAVFMAPGMKRIWRRRSHTAMVRSLYVGGLLLIAVGELLTKPILILMGSPRGCASTGSVIYENQFSWNARERWFYNTSEALFCVQSEYTRRPLYFLLTAGVVNVHFST